MRLSERIGREIVFLISLAKVKHVKPSGKCSAGIFRRMFVVSAFGSIGRFVCGRPSR